MTITKAQAVQIMGNATLDDGALFIDTVDFVGCTPSPHGPLWERSQALCSVLKNMNVSTAPSNILDELNDAEVIESTKPYQHGGDNPRVRLTFSVKKLEEIAGMSLQTVRNRNPVAERPSAAVGVRA